MDFTSTMGLSARGMTAQSTRLRVIAENIANSSTTGSSPGAEPYRRKTVVFANALDASLGVSLGVSLCVSLGVSLGVL